MYFLVCFSLTNVFQKITGLFDRFCPGDEFLRAHRGVCYFYDDHGAFQSVRGVPPESTFGRVKQFLLELEGVFRLLPKDTRRDDDSILGAMQQCRAKYQTWDAYLSACVDAAIFCLGDMKKRKRGAAVDGDGDDGDVDVAVPWNIWIAQGVAKVGLHVQKEMLEDKLIGYIAEWCDTPHQGFTMLNAHCRVVCFFAHTNKVKQLSRNRPTDCRATFELPDEVMHSL